MSVLKGIEKALGLHREDDLATKISDARDHIRLTAAGAPSELVINAADLEELLPNVNVVNGVPSIVGLEIVTSPEVPKGQVVLR